MNNAYSLARRAMFLPEAEEWLLTLFNEKQLALLDLSGMGVLRGRFEGQTFTPAREGVRCLIFGVDEYGEIIPGDVKENGILSDTGDGENIVDILAIDPATNRAALSTGMFDSVGHVGDTLDLYSKPVEWLRGYWGIMADWLERVKEAKEIAPSEQGPRHPLFGEQGTLIIEPEKLRLNVAASWLWNVNEIVCSNEALGLWVDGEIKQQSAITLPRIIARLE